MRATPVWLSIVTAALFSSCALQERIEPKRLDSAPETTGLLVVDVDLRHQGSLTFGFENSVSVDEGTIRLADTRQPVQQRSLKRKLVLFQLRPGTYELVSVKGDFVVNNFTRVVEPFLVTEVGPITIAAGQIAYVGKLTATAHSRLGQPGFTYSHKRNPDRAREIDALTTIEQQYKDSPWIPLLRNRLDSLRQEP